MKQKELVQQIRVWLVGTIISFTALIVGINGARVVTNTGAMKVNSQKSRLQEENRELITKTIKRLQTNQRMNPEIAAERRQTSHALSQARKDYKRAKANDVPDEELRALFRDVRQLERKKSDLRLKLMDDVLANGDPEYDGSYAWTYKRNLEKIEALKSRAGFFYSGWGYLLLWLSAFLLGITAFLGAAGLVWIGGVYGLILLWDSKYVDEK